VGTTPRISDPLDAFDYWFLRQKEPPRPRKRGKRIQVADLFSGCGGLSLGILEAAHATGRGFRSVLAIDSDLRSLRVYEDNLRPTISCNDDIRDIIDGKMGHRKTAQERRLLKSCDRIDVLLAGPPCQGHSDLNNHTRRKDKRNRLYERVGRFAQISRPPVILVENVPAVVHAEDGALYSTVELLRGIGYYVDSSFVQMADIGVPQRRKRHILVASLVKPICVRSLMSKYRVGTERTVRWAIADLETIETNDLVDQPSEHSSENLKRIRYLLENNAYDLPNRLRPTCHRNGHSYKSMYGRMKYDEPAQTVTSGFRSPGQGRFVHPNRPRTLTPHEAARLQFFPDYFDFSSGDTKSALANIIGNAVPMKLTYVFALELILDGTI